MHGGAKSESDFSLYFGHDKKYDLISIFSKTRRIYTGLVVNLVFIGPLFWWYVSQEFWGSFFS